MKTLDANGVNEHGVAMCQCKRFGPVHAWEPGEWCGERVVPKPPSAVISDCGRYRYTLHREWLGGAGLCMFVMLNPSTADAYKNDPTIRRCVKFAQRWGFHEMTVGNLFALRSPHPKELLAADDPVGPENDLWLDRLATAADRHVMAWGAFAAAPARAAEVLGRHAWYTPVCLGTTVDGSPKHPLARGKHRVPDDFEPVPFATPESSKEGE